MDLVSDVQEAIDDIAAGQRESPKAVCNQHNDALLKRPLVTFLVKAHLQGLYRGRDLTWHQLRSFVFCRDIVWSGRIAGLEQRPIRIELLVSGLPGDGVACSTLKVALIHAPSARPDAPTVSAVQRERTGVHESVHVMSISVHSPAISSWVEQVMPPKKLDHQWSRASMPVSHPRSALDQLIKPSGRC